MQRTIYVLALTVLGTVPALAQLKDPLDRDEDISATRVEASVTQRSDGFYEYVYNIYAPDTNKGRILSFSIDIGCSDPPADVIAFPVEADPDAETLSENGNHAPVQLYGNYGEAVDPAISVDNKATWLVALSPGNEALGAKILSPMPPTDREWSIIPSMDTEGWDYSAYDEDDPRVPWIEDFTVFGMAKAPGCMAAPKPR